MHPTPRVIYEFGPFRLDLQRHSLSKTGQPVSLPPKAFEILALLLERRDALVSKTDLLTEIWPHAFVEENNLAQHVSLLRRTLGESREKPQYIETLPRIGYRFIGDVRVIDDRPENGNVLATALAEPPSAGAASRRAYWAIPLLALACAALGVLVVIFVLPKPDPVVSDYLQLTHDGYPKHGPLMTDGEFIYFTEIRDRTKVLVRVPGTGGEPVVLPTTPPGLQALDLSAVRHEILAMPQGSTGGELPLFVGRISSGEYHRVGSIQANSAAWSPRGDHIFYSRGRKLYVVNYDGGESKELMSVDGRVPWLHVSPDARWLTFEIQREAGTTDELWQARLDGTHPQRISPGVSPLLAHPTGTWTHDSKYLLFSENAESRFWLWGLRQPRFGVGTGARFRINTGLWNVTDVVAAVDRDRLLAIEALDRVEIFRLDKSGNLAPYLRGVSADGLAFSRQGDWVAYTTYPDRRLVRSRLDGSDRLQLTGASQSVLMPSWSPDGKQIAYMSNTGAGAWKIFLISKDGGTPEELAPASEDQSTPTWSPDGSSLIYAGAPWLKGFSPNSTPIRRVDLRTRQLNTLPESAGLWSPRWSPDGKYLVAETIDSQKLLLFDFSAGIWTTLASPQSDLIGYTTWSHDSRFVYYNRYLHQRGTIYRVDVKRRVTERVWASDEQGMAVTLGQWFALAPDDSPLLLRDSSVHELFALDLRLP